MVVHSAPSGAEKFTIIGDREGWGYSHCDIRAYLASLTILQVFAFLAYSTPSHNATFNVYKAYLFGYKLDILC